VFAGVDLHKRSLNILKNKYLREDLSTGKLGVGYIMNNLAYEQERENIVEQKGMERVVRLEGHINYQAEEIRKAIEQMSIGVTNSRLISKATRFIKSIGK
jgi:hypothetical protein